MFHTLWGERLCLKCVARKPCVCRPKCEALTNADSLDATIDDGFEE